MNQFSGVGASARHDRQAARVPSSSFSVHQLKSQPGQLQRPSKPPEDDACAEEEEAAKTGEASGGPGGSRGGGRGRLLALS